MLSDNLKSQRVFAIFEQLSSIPRGSGNTEAIAAFCENFAIKHQLKYIRDKADNIIIFKNGTENHKDASPIILQGHLDMVCQKTPDCDIDFSKDGLDLYVDGDFIKAHGTTLGADNGIAVAMVLAILERNDLEHPPIEAVFTSDEETGMIGALALDTNVLRGTRMINLDAETDNIVTVSCAGGSDFKISQPITTKNVIGTKLTIDIGGLKGGHSGVEIDKKRINADMLAGRILNEIKVFPFDIISINGGDKPNAIPNRCVIELCTKYYDDIRLLLSGVYKTIKEEIADREENFVINTIVGQKDEYSCFTDDIKEKVIYTLLCAPNGVVEMSSKIAGLVQSSLNLGVLTTKEGVITMHFALRSNKMSALSFLEKQLCAFFDMLGLSYQTFGQYPAWEYRENSPLRDTYRSCYKELFNSDAEVVAIHAGLECGVFASKIDNFDCIAIGPTMYDVHTTREKLSISSTESIYKLLVEVLKTLK